MRRWQFVRTRQATAYEIDFFDYEPEGRESESLRARHLSRWPFIGLPNLAFPVSPGTSGRIREFTYDEIIEQEIGFIGKPEKVVRQIRNLQSKGGIAELAIVSNFGGMEHWKSIKTQQLFAEQVMAAFRAESEAARAGA